MASTPGIVDGSRLRSAWRAWRAVVAPLVLVGLVVAGCTGSGTVGEVLTPAAGETPPGNPTLLINTAYRLAAGDSVRITTFGHPEVSGEFDIDDDGFIKFPLLGLIEAAGKSMAELEEALRVPLDRDYLVDPQVSAEILSFRPFYITGQVTQPGRYTFSSGMTVRQAVAMAQGYTRRARTASMILIRATDGGALRIEADEDTQIQPGDTIEIRRRYF